MLTILCCEYIMYVCQPNTLLEDLESHKVVVLSRTYANQVGDTLDQSRCFHVVSFEPRLQNVVMKLGRYETFSEELVGNGN